MLSGGKMETYLPDFFIEKIKSEYNEDECQKILEGLSKKRKSSFRINRLKVDSKEIEKILHGENIAFTKSSFFEDAYIVDDIEKVRNLSIYSEGMIYVQSISSMVPPILLDPKENEDILDMCAAPGGKTTELASLSNGRSHITACEMNKIRFEKLKYNKELQAANNVFLMQKDARNLDDFLKYDKILLDSPCSSSGTIYAYDKSISKYFTEDLIKKSVKSQRNLVSKAIKLLKKGGILVYSTCSILKEENEEIVEFILRNNDIEIEKVELDGVSKLHSRIDGVVTICPTEIYEGFFVCKFRKIH